MIERWPFASLLVANRGEVVARILATARRLGLRTLVVYTDADAGMPYVRMADAAVHVPSYLDGAAMIAAARAHGITAVHPGYGFLAESDAFAQQVIDAGLVWVGPTPASMRAVGNKASAKRRLVGSSVPVLPGYDGADQSDATLLAAAREIGLPLMVKAAAGGGGRGMRLVNDANDLESALERARSEAQQAFGCGDLLLERALVAPRHIEVQLFGDMMGDIVHLGERDCSVQRRHQKLIEESPSPAVDASLRVRLTDAALAVARSCDYVGAGTAEFLLDPNGEFWFIEMNTRLQVEHPVTEAVAGVDLVEWQLRVAAGESLPLSQKEIDQRLAVGGHAIEVRLCAEDPERDFMPQSGRIGLWRRPETLRCEDALADGHEVSPHYDSMLAKLIAHDAGRDLARRRLVQGLHGTALLGIATNQDFLIDALERQAFVAGDATTAFIDGGSPFRRAQPDATIAIALVLARTSAGRRYPDHMAGWSNSAALSIPLRIEVDGTVYCASAQMHGTDAWRIAHDGRTVMLRVDAVGENDLDIRLGDAALHLVYWVAGDALFVRCGGANHVVRDISFKPATTKERERDGTVRAPMNGRIVAVHAQAQQQVVAGQRLLVVDAMKMEHSVVAPISGTIVQVHVSAGQQVGPGLLMLEIAPMENP
jgi:geranyl-CoA carboxylase alpha subunit